MMLIMMRAAADNATTTKIVAATAAAVVTSAASADVVVVPEVVVGKFVFSSSATMSKASPRVVLRSCLTMYNDHSWLYAMMTSDVR